MAELEMVREISNLGREISPAPRSIVQMALRAGITLGALRVRHSFAADTLHIFCSHYEATSFWWSLVGAQRNARRSSHKFARVSRVGIMVQSSASLRLLKSMTPSVLLLRESGLSVAITLTTACQGETVRTTIL